jgi:hypothetical protein
MNNRFNEYNKPYPKKEKTELEYAESNLFFAEEAKKSFIHIINRGLTEEARYQYLKPEIDKLFKFFNNDIRSKRFILNNLKAKTENQ